MCSKGCGKMGNYYEGRLIFALKRNLPDELLHDLSVLASERSCDRDITTVTA